MTERARALASGGIAAGPLTIPARELHVRATTSGGPGGQHANRTLSRIVVTFDIVHAESLNDDHRTRLLNAFGPLVSASSSSSRSQSQNRAMAYERLARKISDALYVDPDRRATKPTRASVARRLDDKNRRARKKSDRRVPFED